MQNITAIMLESKSGNKFFVKKIQLSKLQDFIKTFKLKLYYVKTNYKDLLDIEALIKNFCNQNYETPEIEYTILQTNAIEKKRTLSKKGSSL